MKRYSLKDFIPLILIFLIIIGLTTAKQIFSPLWNMQSIAYDFMGIFFIIFSSFKIINLKNFAQVYATYDLIAKRSRIYAQAYPFIELSLGILYIMRLYLWQTNVITLIVMLVSAAGVAYELSKGKEITCACLGMVFKVPMTYVTLAEDLLMALMALIMVLL